MKNKKFSINNEISKVILPLYTYSFNKDNTKSHGFISEDHILETRRRGRIEVICGSMFQGKRKS